MQKKSENRKVGIVDDYMQEIKLQKFNKTPIAMETVLKCRVQKLLALSLVGMME